MCDLWRIGKHLKAARKNQGLTKLQVSQAIGIDRNHISHMEDGTFIGSVEDLQSYANYLEFQLSVGPKSFPQLDELSILFDEE